MARKCNIDPNCPGPEWKGCPDSPVHDPSCAVTQAEVDRDKALDAITAAVNAIHWLQDSTGKDLSAAHAKLFETSAIVEDLLPVRV